MSTFVVLIHSCRNPAACPGNSSGTCARGYTSNLCGECETNWGSPKPFVCRECWPSQRILTLYILAALALLVYAKVLCHFTLSGHTTPATLGPVAIPVQGPPDESGQQKQRQQPHSTAVCATDIAHVFVFYLQCMWILSSISVRYPASLSAPFQALQWLFSTSSPRALGIDCIIRNQGRLTVATQEFLLSITMPLAVMLALLAYEMLVGIVKGAAAQSHIHQHHCAVHLPASVAACCLWPFCLRATG